MLCGSVMEVIEAGLLGLLGCFSAFRNQNPEPWQRDKSLPARSASAGLQLSPGLSQAHPTPAGSSRPALALLQPAGHPALALPKEHQGLAAESSLVPHQGECHRPDCPGEGGRAGHLPGLGAGQAAVLSSWRKPGGHGRAPSSAMESMLCQAGSSSLPWQEGLAQEDVATGCAQSTAQSWTIPSAFPPLGAMDRSVDKAPVTQVEGELDPKEKSKLLLCLAGVPAVPGAHRLGSLERPVALAGSTSSSGLSL